MSLSFYIAKSHHTLFALIARNKKPACQHAAQDTAVGWISIRSIKDGVAYDICIKNSAVATCSNINGYRMVELERIRRAHEGMRTSLKGCI